MYIKRALSNNFRKAISMFPAILVTGPRQSGKTTFIKHQFGDSVHYVSFDDPLERAFAIEDPNGFLNRFEKGPVILDEIQYVPQLFSYLKLRIDKNREKSGQWIMTGSQQFSVMKNVSDSLAGRVAILELLPMHWLEYGKSLDRIEDLIWNGGYPEVVTKTEIRDLWVKSYLATYIERDLHQLINVKDLSLFQSFISYCASIHAQELNIAGLSRNCGVSQPTCKQWLSVLQACYLITFVPPYYNNLGKRIVKSPKLYFLDPLIVAYLTKQPSPDALFSGAMGGAFFEGFVVTETMKILDTYGFSQSVYYFRSNDGTEIDMLIEMNGKIYPVEIKKTATPTLKHASSLRRLIKSEHGKRIGEAKIICNVSETKMLPDNIVAIPWKNYLQWLDRLLKDF